MSKMLFYMAMTFAAIIGASSLVGVATAGPELGYWAGPFALCASFTFTGAIGGMLIVNSDG